MPRLQTIEKSNKQTPMSFSRRLMDLIDEAKVILSPSEFVFFLADSSRHIASLSSFLLGQDLRDRE